MKSEFVSFEIAKLANDNSFDEACLAFYSSDTTEFILMSGYVQGRSTTNDLSSLDYVYVAPLHQQLLHWFREKHKLFINVNFDDEWWSGVFILPDCQFSNLEWIKTEGLNGSTYFKTYKEALEHGFKQAFKIISHE